MVKNNDAPDRATALVHQAVDVLQRLRHAPASPVSAFVRAKDRRQLRREAARLRAGQTEPMYRNLYSPEMLAGVYERTARRDEMLEEAVKDFRELTLALGRVLEENDPAVEAALEALVAEARRSAEEQGPGSEAAARYQQLQFLGWFGGQWHSRRRRQRGRPDPETVWPADPAEARYAMSAAVLLDSAPPGEPVVAIPPEGSGPARERVVFRIGIGAGSWIGSFESGNERFSTVCAMPDGEHLFVCAKGAGYVVHARSRTLVETVGMDVVAVSADTPLTLFVVDHGGRSLEAFGRTGRLWKAEGISSGSFRQLRLTSHVLAGEAWHWWRAGWVEFAVSLATGEVRFAR